MVDEVFVQIRALFVEMSESLDLRRLAVFLDSLPASKSKELAYAYAKEHVRSFSMLRAQTLSDTAHEVGSVVLERRFSLVGALEGSDEREDRFSVGAFSPDTSSFLLCLRNTFFLFEFPSLQFRMSSEESPLYPVEFVAACGCDEGFWIAESVGTIRKINSLGLELDAKSLDMPFGQAVFHPFLPILAFSTRWNSEEDELYLWWFEREQKPQPIPLSYQEGPLAEAHWIVALSFSPCGRFLRSAGHVKHECASGEAFWRWGYYSYTDKIDVLAGKLVNGESFSFYDAIEEQPEGQDYESSPLRLRSDAWGERWFLAHEFFAFVTQELSFREAEVECSWMSEGALLSAVLSLGELLERPVEHLLLDVAPSTRLIAIGGDGRVVVASYHELFKEEEASEMHLESLELREQEHVVLEFSGKATSLFFDPTGRWLLVCAKPDDEAIRRKLTLFSLV